MNELVQLHSVGGKVPHIWLKQNIFSKHWNTIIILQKFKAEMWFYFIHLIQKAWEKGFIVPFFYIFSCSVSTLTVLVHLLSHRDLNTQQSNKSKICFVFQIKEHLKRQEKKRACVVLGAQSTLTTTQQTLSLFYFTLFMSTFQEQPKIVFFIIYSTIQFNPFNDFLTQTMFSSTGQNIKTNFTAAGCFKGKRRNFNLSSEKQLFLYAFLSCEILYTL